MQSEARSESELLVLAAQEDEELYLARAIEANMGLMVDQASITHVSGLNHEEVMSEMKLATIYAIRTYESDKGAWSSWLRRCLRHWACNLIRQRQKKQRWMMDNTLEYEHDKHTLSYEDAHWHNDWPIKGLTVKQGAILELHYLLGHTLKHIGKVVGCCAQLVAYKRDVALSRARDIMDRATPVAI